MNIRYDDDERPQFQWSPPETVPVCLLEHIQLIAIKCFVGREDELQAVEYLLNNARVLNIMLIGFDPNSVDEDVVKKVLMFPRASVFCQVGSL